MKYSNVFFFSSSISFYLVYDLCTVDIKGNQISNEDDVIHDVICLGKHISKHVLVAFAGKLSVNQKRHNIDRRWFTGVLLMVKTKMEINNTNVMTKPKTT